MTAFFHHRSLVTPVLMPCSLLFVTWRDARTVVALLEGYLATRAANQGFEPAGPVQLGEVV